MTTSAAPPARHRSRAIADPGALRRRPAWVDRIAGSDPGLQRLRTALQAVATIGAAMAAEYLFVHLTHALQLDTHGATLSPQQAALVAAQHHGLLVIAIMLGAIVGMLASFGGALFGTPVRTLVNFALIPVPMVGGLAIGLALGNHRVLALGSLTVVLALGAYCRRFGPSGFLGGMFLFMGNFFGFFLHTEVSLSDLGWLAAEIGLGALVAIVAQFTMFYPSRRAALRRMVRSYTVRAREVSTRALELLDTRPADRERVVRSLHRRLVRLNETALLIDAQLGTPSAVPARWSAAELHQRLFDSELAVSTMGRLAERIADYDLTPAMRDQVRDALHAVSEFEVARARRAGERLLDLLRDPSADQLDHNTRIVLFRFATSVGEFARSAQAGRAPTPAPVDDAAGQFQPAVPSFGGWLPGSSAVSAAASLEPGQRLRDRARLQPYTRVAIQMAVAVTAAIVLGDLLSGRRFYWAVIAAFVTFMGANNAGEQMRKGALRVVGTVVGVFLGALGAHLVGNRTDLAIGVILTSLFLGLYLMRVSYAFMVVGITIMVSQLYVQLDEYSDSLLRLRLEETALGAGVAVLTVLCVVPLRQSRVIRMGIRHYLQALSATVTTAVGRLSGQPECTDVELRSALRRLDGAFQALVSTVAPPGIPFAGRLGGPDTELARLMHAVAASRQYARNLQVDSARAGRLLADSRDDLARAGSRLTTSIEEVLAAGADGRFSAHTYVRAAGSFAQVADRYPGDDRTAARQLALRDLQLIDGAVAAVASAARMPVEALDTSAALDRPAEGDAGDGEEPTRSPQNLDVSIAFS